MFMEAVYDDDSLARATLLPLLCRGLGMMALTGIERPGRGSESVLVSGVSRPVQDLQARSLMDMLLGAGQFGRGRNGPLPT